MKTGVRLALLVAPFSLLALASAQSPSASPATVTGGFDLAAVAAREQGPSPRELRRRFNQRLMVEGYERFGHRSPAWDGEARAFLREMVAYYAGEATRTDAELVAQARALVRERGCRDPLVWYCLGDLLLTDRQLFEAKRALLQSACYLEKHPYPKLVHRLVAARLARIYRNHASYDGGLWRQWCRREVEWTAANLVDGMYGPDERMLMWEHIDDCWDDCLRHFADELLEELRRTEGVDPWVLDMVVGARGVTQAWWARGGGFASKVTDEGWAGYRTNLAQAAAGYTSAWRRHPEYPQAAHGMLDVVVGGEAEEGETLDLWYERAVTACFDYPAVYRTYAHYRQPRWGGSLREMYQLARDCALTRRYDTQVPYQLYRIFGLMRGDATASGLREPWSRAETFPLLREMFEGYMARTTGATHAAHATRMFVCAWRCGRMTEAYELLQRHDALLQPDLVQLDFEESLDAIRAEVAARGGPLRERLAQLEAEAAKDPETATQSYAVLAQDGTLDPWTRRYAADRAVVWGVAAQARGKAWFPIQPDARLAGWTVKEGEWWVEPDGALVGRSNRNGLHLRLQGLLPTAFELRGEVELVETPQPWKFNAGFVFGFTGEDYLPYASTLLHQNEKVLTLRKGYGEYRWPKGEAVDLRPVNRLHLRFRHGMCRVLLNDRPVFPEFSLHDLNLGAALQIALGGQYDYRGAVVRYRHLEARALPDDEPLAGSP
jgi:hypothetical protein